jgi:uncharacterized PurR-regulated membrane protein YhhQ (DUF165 family)
MMLILMYLSAIVLANLSSAHFGPSASIWNAFLLIGLTLSTRDRLHEQWGSKVKQRMFLLILAGGLLSYLINQGAGKIAVASCVAFAVSETLDAILYGLMHRHPYLLKSNTSNILGAATDSLIFPTLAFGGLMWPIVIGQFVAKTLGGLIWSLILQPRKAHTWAPFDR